MDRAKGLTRQITLRLCAFGPNHIELQIQDSGPGLTPKARRRILREPFSTKDDKEESGFGLLIAQGLIESMNGSINLYPAVSGQGALFAIRLSMTRPLEKEQNHGRD